MANFHRDLSAHSILQFGIIRLTLANSLLLPAASFWNGTRGRDGADVGPASASSAGQPRGLEIDDPDASVLTAFRATALANRYRPRLLKPGEVKGGRGNFPMITVPSFVTCGAASPPQRDPDTSGRKGHPTGNPVGSWFAALGRKLRRAQHRFILAWSLRPTPVERQFIVLTCFAYPGRLRAEKSSDDR